MTLSLRTVAHSEIGLIRKNNQDSGYASPTLLVVADGMGGAAAGDLASAVAVDELRRADGPHTGSEMLTVLAETTQRANDRLADLVADDPSLDGMGTTVCGALFDGEHLGVVHIGDSRGYLLRDGTLTRLTHDHSWVQSLVDDGRITLDEAQTHPHRSLLLKVLNGQPVTEPDLFLAEVRAGDRVLFCSDGLCGLVSDEVIADLLAEPDLDHCVADLTEAAHAEGGLDNITIILSEVRDGPAEGPAVSTASVGEGRPSGTGLVLGAAVDRVIPTLHTRPVDIDDADHDAGDGHEVPVAPPPVGVDPEAERYALQAERPRRRLGWIISAAVVAALLIAALWGVYAYGATRYFIGASANTVTIYQGLPGKLMGVQLHRVAEETAVQMTDLPPSWQQRVRNTIVIRDGGLEAARTTVSELQVKSEACIAQRAARAQATTPPSPTPTPTAPTSPGTSTSTPDQTSSPGQTPSVPVTPTPQPTPSTPDEC